jgi:TPP-dependent pyruvate/acetoin dehydrogenase alpha subunit
MMQRWPTRGVLCLAEVIQQTGGYASGAAAAAQEKQQGVLIVVPGDGSLREGFSTTVKGATWHACEDRTLQ